MKYNSIIAAEKHYRHILNEGLCVYCGQKASGWDHFFPMNFGRILYDLRKIQDTMVKVESCLRCNESAGSFPNWTFAQRWERTRQDYNWKMYDNASYNELVNVWLNPVGLSHSNINWKRVNDRQNNWFNRPEVLALLVKNRAN